MKNRNLKILLLMAFTMVVNINNAQENDQNSLSERYKRANEVQKVLYQNVILNGVVYPHWIDKTDKFWYGKETAKGKEYMLIDAENQKKISLFDHDDLANKLITMTGKEVNSEDLPLKEFKITPQLDVAFFNAFGNYWEYNLTKRSF